MLHWNELDTVDQKGLEISFTQTSGDFAEFYGRWLIPAGEVHFEVTYDFGIDSLAGLMDPIAERVVTRVIFSVLSGLFGDRALFGNFLKPFAVPFEPAPHPAFTALETAVAR